MRLVLKVDVDTYRGTREGVPRLVEILRQHDARATFLFSLGPDHTGRAIRRLFRRGFARKVRRTSVLRHYGVKTLLYGTLLPGPDIGRACADILRHVKAAGHEVGVHCWDHVRWQDGVAHADAAWTRRQLSLAAARFAEIFGTAPTAHGAAGWQMNVHALRLTQRMGLAYASDTRGSSPFLPMINGELIICPQLPTTLPTLDELLGSEELAGGDVVAHLLRRTAVPPVVAHVYTLHAELEGMKLAPVFQRLIEGWRAQGYQLISAGELAESLDLAKLPRHELALGEVPGRAGRLMLQGEEFLADFAAASQEE